MAVPGEHHPASAGYCEAIYELHEDDVEVIQARIAERLRVSRPSVSEMIKRLSDERLVRVEGGRISLTEKGEGLAQRVVRRHRLAERFLTDILGLSWASAHHEAGKWEHVMSEEVEEAMIARLGNPTTCPHGNPIPGSDYLAPDHVRLVDVEPGSRFTVTRIPEELEFVPGMLEFLERSRLVPGSSGLVRRLDEDGTMLVAVDDEDVNLDPRASARILVTR